MSVNAFMSYCPQYMLKKLNKVISFNDRSKMKKSIIVIKSTGRDFDLNSFHVTSRKSRSMEHPSVYKYKVIDKIK